MEEVTEEVKIEQPATNNQDVDNSNAQIPTDTPTPVEIGPGVYRLFGRKVIYVDYKEEDINEKTIQEILTKVFHVHLQNANEIDYLEKYYKGYTSDKIASMNEEEFYEYISKLWAMIIWGNKHYIIDKYINDNGFENLKKSIA